VVICGSGSLSNRSAPAAVLARVLNAKIAAGATDPQASVVEGKR
jgi:hypothetical protein